ncbi:TetR/AcrR family transcriptional regulator [Nocardiopsis sp. CNR-923]|uniref:TetR/AcrR family transcriptional regulator n=1 Tax=Nocardiopsis sp. CNR-923 TaxID=1904965 RepID=UPI0009F9855E|nr:TetR/AcrR family transcriptional regulator [Nocardiopsis sp. CNR-923]
MSRSGERRALPTRSTNKTANRAARAERILDAAGDLLVSWGYPRITIEDVARRAGVGKGTVYLHFPTKEVLFLAVLLRAQTAMTERTLEVLREAPRGSGPAPSPAPTPWRCTSHRSSPRW